MGKKIKKTTKNQTDSSKKESIITEKESNVTAALAVAEVAKHANETEQDEISLTYLETEQEKCSKFYQKYLKIQLPPGDRITVGVDTHQSTYYVALYSHTLNQVVKDWSQPSSAKDLIRQLEPIKGIINTVWYEAGPCGFGLARTMMKAGYPVGVIAPSKMPTTSNQDREPKSDRLDAIKLACMGGQGSLKSIYIPTEQQENDRRVFRTREHRKQQLAHCKQRIKSILLCHGLTLKVGLSKAWSKAGIEELKQMALNEELRWSMDEMLAELQEVRLAVVRCNRKLREMAKLPRYREMVARLMTVPGVGNIVAMGMVLEVLDMERFASGRCLAKYLGLAPLTRESGKKKIEEGRCSAGMQKVRTLLIESAWRWRQQDAYAREQYNKYYKNCGGIAQKAITALARKLALILWRLALGNRELGKLPYLPGLKRVPPSAIARNPQ